MAFENRKLFHVKKHYIIGEQELTRVVHVLRIWHCYLEGADYVIVIDHNPFTYLNSQQILSRHETRWLEYLKQTLTYKWKYRLGRINIADPLSCYTLEINAHNDVLSHDCLGCRDVKLRVILAMSCSLLSSREMATNISKDAPSVSANDQLVVKEQSFFQSIVT